jgi:hypothetical protein
MDYFTKPAGSGAVYSLDQDTAQYRKLNINSSPFNLLLVLEVYSITKKK